MSKSQLLELQVQKRQLEKELEMLSHELETYKGRGFDQSLVDEEGFPKANLDFGELTIYRNLKRTFNEKNNDYSTLMKRVEENLFAYHAEIMKDKDNQLFQQFQGMNKPE